MDRLPYPTYLGPDDLAVEQLRAAAAVDPGHCTVTVASLRARDVLNEDEEEAAYAANPRNWVYWSQSQPEYAESARGHVTRAQRVSRAAELFDRLTRGRTQAVIFGDATRLSGLRGRRPGIPIKAMLRWAVSNGYRVFLVNEYNTSKMTSCCGVEGEHVVDGQYRYGTVRCPVCGMDWDRDRNAARNIKIAAVAAGSGNPRPLYLQWPGYVFGQVAPFAAAGVAPPAANAEDAEEDVVDDDVAVVDVDGEDLVMLAP
jgi:hypothetical protein